MKNVHLPTTTLSTESVSNCGIELEKKKEKNIENKNKPLQEKIAKQKERITELEKKKKENVQKIKELQSENKAITGFIRQFCIINFNP